MFTLRSKEEKLQNTPTFYDFRPLLQLAQGPRGGELRVDIPEYHQTTCENSNVFGILSRVTPIITFTISTGLLMLAKTMSPYYPRS